MRLLFISTLTAGLLGSAALAQDIVRTNPFIGVWRCSGFGNVPKGVLTVANPMYEFQAVDTNWTPVDSASNGGGIITFGAGEALPFRGPLLTVFAVTGSFVEGSEILSWESTLDHDMTCLRQVN